MNSSAIAPGTVNDICDDVGKQLFVGPPVDHKPGKCFFCIERKNLTCDWTEATSSPIAVNRLSKFMTVSGRRNDNHIPCRKPTAYGTGQSINKYLIGIANLNEVLAH
jgi:hypothetical protein